MLIAILATAAAVAPADPVASATPAIDRANAAWLADIRSGNADGLAQAYADDGLFVLPDGRTIQGKTAIRAFYAARAAAKDSIVGGELHSLGRSAVRPDLVLEWGEGSLRVRADDGSIGTRGGPYVTLWQRQSDGVWRIVRNLVF
jgi:uncharacterized protein (TIGR02246 family)